MDLLKLPVNLVFHLPLHTVLDAFFHFFDEYTEADVFEEVTGITEDDFRFLRDGGEYTNPETGKKVL